MTLAGNRRSQITRQKVTVWHMEETGRQLSRSFGFLFFCVSMHFGVQLNERPVKYSCESSSGRVGFIRGHVDDQKGISGVTLLTCHAQKRSVSEQQRIGKQGNTARCISSLQSTPMSAHTTLATA